MNRIHIAFLLCAILISSGCSDTKNESSPKDSPDNIAATENKNDAQPAESVLTNKEAESSKLYQTVKKIVDTPENQEIAKKTVAAPSWQETFVQKHSGGPVQTGPVYERFWSDVEKTGDDVVKAAGKNGSVTKAQLANSLDNGSFHGEQAQVAGAMYESFDQIKTQGAISRAFFTAKISTGDISKTISRVKDSEKRFHAVDDLTYWADNQKNLQRFSGDGSGAVTYQDLTNALGRHDINNEDRANLQALESKFHAIAPDGKLGKDDIDNYYNNFLSKDSGYQLNKQILHDMRHVSDVQADPNSRLLFADKNPLDSIKVDNVTQGFAGSCAFKASLAAVVATDPSSIIGMVRPRSAKDLEVTFPGTKSIHIKPPSAEEIGLYSWQAARGNWASALEKAYGQKVYEGAAQKGPMQGQIGADRAAADGFTEHALQTLTGHKIDLMDVTTMGAGQLRSVIDDAQRDKRALVLNSPPGDPSAKTADGYAIDHAFTILGMNAHGDVTVRDPRANGQDRPDGISQISIEKLKSNFKVLYVETDKQA